MNISKILEIATFAGEIMLKSGAETYRVEDTINRICSVSKSNFIESFVLPTGIVTSIMDENGNFITISKRINNRTIDLSKIALVNQFSRDFVAGKINYEKAYEILKEIDYKKGYKSIYLSIAAGLACTFSTILFKGSVFDAIASFFVGFFSQFLFKISQKNNLSWFISYILGGFSITFFSFLLVLFQVGESIDKIIIGSVLILTPGVAITNAIRDTIAGDLLSGVARAIEAILIAIFIALGAGIGLLIANKIGGGII